MDLRRSNRPVIDPKVRQVGFFTQDSAAASSNVAGGVISSAASAPHSSLSPVMIPPPRHQSAEMNLLDNPHYHPVGSYNPSEAILGSPPTMSVSRSSRFEADGSELVDEEEDDESVAWEDATPRSTALVSQMSSRITPIVSETTKKDSIGTKTGSSPNPTQIKEKPKLTKAERRAIQEAQRAAKAASKETGNPTSSKQPKQSKQPIPSQQKKEKDMAGSGPNQVAPIQSAGGEKKTGKKEVAAPHPRMQFDDVARVEKAKRRAVVNQSEAKNRVELFRHLPQYVHGTQLPDLEAKFFHLHPMHPSVFQVGLQYLSNSVSGANERCIVMLLAFRSFVDDYEAPPEKTINQYFSTQLSSCVSFLSECRPLSISMGNAVRFLKSRISNLSGDITISEFKQSLHSDIDQFITKKIIIANKAIVQHAVTKIRNGDVLLTYGSPSLIESIMTHAHEINIKFRVVIVDSRPMNEGKKLLRRLVEKGIECCYTHINAVAYVMHEVTRVFLGASSVLRNGTVYSSVGTACIAMVAKEFRVPVLVCCETYKFHERVQLDSICSNELGDPDVIAKVEGRKDVNYLNDWAENGNLQLLNLKHDVTPSDYVSVLVTEQGMLPPTSVPVIIRQYGLEQQLWT